jgi:hypothetical protein
LQFERRHRPFAPTEPTRINGLFLTFAEYVHRSYFGLYSANKISHGGRIPPGVEQSIPLVLRRQTTDFSEEFFVSELDF